MIVRYPGAAIGLIIAGVIMALLVSCSQPTPVPTVTQVPPTTTLSPTPTPVPPTLIPMPTATPVPPTLTPMPTATPVPPTYTHMPTATPVPPTYTPTPTATPVPPTPAPTPTPIPPTYTSTPTATPVPPTYTPTPTPTATPIPPTLTTAPTQIPGKSDLHAFARTPEHMAAIWWDWDRDADSKLREFREMEIDFTIHNNVRDFSDQNGIYLMLSQSNISDVGFYFGLQTDVYAPDPPYWRGKGLIFSRWKTRDLANARVADLEEGWTQSSGHEGDFIGVRRSYEWGAGDYQVRIAPDGAEPDGEWFGLWITDLSSNMTTWIGSLKFPFLNGTATIGPSSYTTVEIYGHPIRPIDIPEWHISVERPLGDGVPSSSGLTVYSSIFGDVLNSDIRYAQMEDRVHFRAGGATERTTPSGRVYFK